MKKWTIKLVAKNEVEAMEMLQQLSHIFGLADKTANPMDHTSLEYNDKSLICNRILILTKEEEKGKLNE